MVFTCAGVERSRWENEDEGRYLCCRRRIGFGTLKEPRTLRFLPPIIAHTKVSTHARSDTRALATYIRDCVRFLRIYTYMCVWLCARNVSPSTSRSPKPMIGRVDRITRLGEALPLGLKFLASLYGVYRARFLYFFFLTETKRDVFAYLNFTF